MAVGLEQLWSGTSLVVAFSVTAAVLLAIGCSLTGFSDRTFKKKDPGAFVLDEIVGYLITVAIFSAVYGDPGFWGHFTAFFAFRGFDVLKPPPARQFEALPGAPGIMLDDVMAGIYAGLSCLLVPQVVPEFFA